MPDITMCQNHKCEKKEECYRYKATPNLIYQSYANFNCSKENEYKYYLRYVKR